MATTAFELGFVMGFIVALALAGAICKLAGAARMARVFDAFAGGRHVHRRRATGTRSPVEQEVFQALIGLKCAPFAASRAVGLAARTAPQEFEPLFRAALSELPGGIQSVSMAAAAKRSIQ